MTDPRITSSLRDAGYETLLILTSFAALSLRPTLRHALELDDRIGRALNRRADLRALEERGLVEAGSCKEGTILKITKLGRITLAGGREPEAAWRRPWDGHWRVLNFDIPRRDARTRSRFWRWLRHNHFGKLQGSAWISPDPIEGVEEVASQAGFDPDELFLFIGRLGGHRAPQDVASRAWNFRGINESYGEYLDFARRIQRQIAKKAPSRRRMRELLRSDRQAWWRAVRRDPLLPAELHPAPYDGPRAWEARQVLHAALFKAGRE